MLFLLRPVFYDPSVFVLECLIRVLPSQARFRGRSSERISYFDGLDNFVLHRLQSLL